MSTAIGVYDSHKNAIDAVRALKDSGYDVKKISVIGKADIEVVDDEMNVQSKNPLNLAGLGVGTTLGTALGVLTGVGLFAIPGVGFLYGAGAVVGAIAGFDFGLIGGGIASVLTTLGMQDDESQKYQEHLTSGKFIVAAQGEEDEVRQAVQTLKIRGTAKYVSAH